MRQAPRTHANSSMTVNRASDGQYRPDGTGRDEWIREPAMYVRESARFILQNLIRIIESLELTKGSLTATFAVQEVDASHLPLPKRSYISPFHRLPVRTSFH